MVLCTPVIYENLVFFIFPTFSLFIQSRLSIFLMLVFLQFLFIGMFPSLARLPPKSLRRFCPCGGPPSHASPQACGSGRRAVSPSSVGARTTSIIIVHFNPISEDSTSRLCFVCILPNININTLPHIWFEFLNTWGCCIFLVNFQVHGFFVLVAFFLFLEGIWLFSSSLYMGYELFLFISHNHSATMRSWSSLRKFMAIFGWTLQKAVCENMGLCVW